VRARLDARAEQAAGGHLVGRDGLALDAPAAAAFVDPVDPGADRRVIGMGVEEGDLARQPFGVGDAVGGHEGDVGTACELDALGERGPVAFGWIVPHDADARIVESADELFGLFVSAINDDQKFEFAERLIQDAVHSRGQVGRRPGHWQEHRDRCRHREASIAGGSAETRMDRGTMR